MKVELVKKQSVSKSTTIFWFKPECPIRYTAGQFIELTIKHNSPDSRGEKRWFTLSSSPTEKLLAITTKFAGDKNSSFKKTLFNSLIGTSFNIVQPMGDFVLPKDEKIPLVFVAGGIGITPFRSMLKYLNDRNEKRDITVIYSVSNLDEIAFDELIQANSSVFIKNVGQFSAETIIKSSDKNKNPIYFLSGPERMIESLQKALLKENIKPENIRTDFFHNYD